jgi:hypothetical protein
MATLVGYNERFAPIAIDRLRCDRLVARLWAQFHEVKLEVKIRDINGTNGSRRCIRFWQRA